MIVRGTTPTHVFNIPFSIDKITEAYITYEQDGRTVIDKRLDDIEADIFENTLTLQLTQDNTLGFVVNEKPRDNIVTIQIKLLFDSDIVCCSRPIRDWVVNAVRDGKIYADSSATAIGSIVTYDGGGVEGW